MSRDDERVLRWIVTGRVQGVSFRYFTEQAASFLRLSGWVRNLSDGSVEIRVRGSADKIEKLREQVERGPRMSRVDSVAEQELAADTALPEKFEVRF